jgi:UDP-2,3-diacylglucosamine pyrophosphatase LpxH
MHLFLAAAQGKVLVEFPRLLSGALYEGRFPIVRSVRERKFSNFYERFLQLKAQAPEVSDDQVIAQAIKVLCAGPLHSHLFREWPKTVAQLYEEFAKFDKSKVSHFRKLEKQRKGPKHDEASRPPHHNN